MNTKEELQKLLDNADINYLADLNKVSIAKIISSPSELSHPYFILKAILNSCKKEPTLHDKLIEYGFNFKDDESCPIYKKNHIRLIHRKCDNDMHIVIDIPDCYADYYVEMFIKYDQYHRIFDAIKLFEKWSEE